MSQTSRQPSQPHGSPSHGHGNIGLFGLVVGAIGVVFGDIGTSPLYTIREAFSPHYGLVANHDTVLGVLSMIFWSLTLVVTVKYVTIIMRADNDGEGGIMALMALAQRCFPKDSRTAYIVGILGIFGASLFFGDGVITPAVTVLSAIEGLEVVAPRMHAWIVPITVLVLIVPLLRMAPSIYSWRVRSKIFRCYGDLKFLENELRENYDARSHADYRERLDRIEDEAYARSIPLAFSDLLYTLRQHIDLVRDRLRQLERRQLPESPR